MPTEFFHKARNLQITDGNFNHVEGDQIHYTPTIVQAKEKEPTIFDEYYKVKLGGICKLRHIGTYQDEGRMGVGLRADRTVCTARVVDRPGMVFTVVQYSGPGAQRAFEEDFRRLARILTSNASQIYGYSKSEIPSIIMHNELIPAVHLNVGWLGREYVSNVAVSSQRNLRNNWNELVIEATGL
ncbi:hypothetical protein PM082_007569 [Marasmius tenuissimus]|nr:hypothetical protein PM082_007569 [Marasmius tenuissimus]